MAGGGIRFSDQSDPEQPEQKDSEWQEDIEDTNYHSSTEVSKSSLNSSTTCGDNYTNCPRNFHNHEVILQHSASSSMAEQLLYSSPIHNLHNVNSNTNTREFTNDKHINHRAVRRSNESERMVTSGDNSRASSPIIRGGSAVNGKCLPAQTEVLKGGSTSGGNISTMLHAGSTFSVLSDTGSFSAMPAHVFTNNNNMSSSSNNLGICTDLKPLQEGKQESHCHVSPSVACSPISILETYEKGSSSPAKCDQSVLKKQKFQRRSNKYCAHLADLLSIEKLVSKHVDVVCTKNKEGKTKSLQKVTSVYLDTPQLELCKRKLAKEDGAYLIRVRWYGNNGTEAPPSKRKLQKIAEPLPSTAFDVFVERKTYHCPSSDKASVKERFTMSSDLLVNYLNGGTDVYNSEYIGNGKEDSGTRKLAQEIQAAVMTGKLKPVLATQYVRRQFQSNKDGNEIRVTVDNEVRMAKKDQTMEGLLGGNDFSSKPSMVVTSFPYGIIETKLRIKDKLTPGVEDNAKLAVDEPEWLTSLTESNIIRKLPISKYAFGCGALYEAVMPLMPSWFNAARDINFLGVAGLSSTSTKCSNTSAEEFFLSEKRKRGFNNLDRQQSCPLDKTRNKFDTSSTKNPFVWNELSLKHGNSSTYFSCADADSLKASAQELFNASKKQKMSNHCSQENSPTLSFKSIQSCTIPEMHCTTQNQNKRTNDPQVVQHRSVLVSTAPPQSAHQNPNYPRSADKDLEEVDRFAPIKRSEKAHSKGKRGIRDSIGQLWGKWRRPSLQNSFDSADDRERDSKGLGKANRLELTPNPSSRTRKAPTANHSIPASSRIEPKTYLANERTFLGWLSIGITIATFSIALMDFGGDSAFISGCIYTPIAVIFMIYSLIMYNKRGNQIRNLHSGAFDDRYGPCILVFLLIVTVIVNLIVVIRLRGP
eukprot:Nk52_evm3s39 gene=Nk52_evmTU3s39